MAKPGPFDEPLSTINVIETTSGIIRQVVSYHDDAKGNKLAEALFSRLARENDSTLTDPERVTPMQPYIRFVVAEGNSRRLFYGRAANADGWSRVIGWHSTSESTSAYTRALGAGCRHVSEMEDVTPLERLPHGANGGFE